MTKRATKIPDAELVKRLTTDVRIQEALYNEWYNYFETHYRGVFFNIDNNKDVLIHDAFMTLYKKVESGAIYADDCVRSADGKPFSCRLTTFMMKIAINKNRELVRSDEHLESLDDVNARPVVEEAAEYPFSDEPDELLIREIVASTIADMSERCRQVLTLFYYKQKNLDEILDIMPSFESKDALKTHKHKCMTRLKEIALDIYNSYLNS